MREDVSSSSGSIHIRSYCTHWFTTRRNTALKPKCVHIEILYGPHFPAFWVNTERYYGTPLLLVYSYFLYDNFNLLYAAAMTWLYYVCLSFYYVLWPFTYVIQLCYNCIATFPYPKFTFDHVHLLSDVTTFLFGWVHFPFRFVK